jgi:Protein of unknown function (DUF2794)
MGSSIGGSMSERDVINTNDSDQRITPFRLFSNHEQNSPQRVAFTRDELQTILNLYGRMVAIGEWKDYAMDFLSERAVFSVFRRTSEVPLYRIEKTPKLAAKQGAFSITAATGLILRRGNDLSRVLNVLEKKIQVVSI